MENKSVSEKKQNKFSICHRVFVALTENVFDETRRIVVVAVAVAVAVAVEGILWAEGGVGAEVASVEPALAMKVPTVVEGPALAGVEGELVGPTFPVGCVVPGVACSRLRSVTVVSSVPGNHTGSDDAVARKSDKQPMEYLD